MEKACIFLSDNNYVMLYDLRKISLPNKIEVFPCNNIFEMFNKYHDGANCILVESIEKFNNIKKYISNELYRNIFFVDGKQIFDIDKNLYCDSIEQFFTGSVFCNKINKFDKKQTLALINSKLDDLGIVANNRYALYIKDLIYEMRKRNIQSVSKKLMETVALTNLISCSCLCDLIRPTVKDYAKLLQQKGVLISTNRTKSTIDALYKYCFEN